MNIWQILGIEKTKKEAVIKAAYRQKLSEYHPEDYPEEFKQIRGAYEEALQRAKESDVDENEESLGVTRIDQWMEEIAEIYCDFTLRRDIEVWRKMLQKDVCISLDTASEVSERLLEFFLDHYRLSPEIATLLDEHFGWTENKEELSKMFPSDFIEFLLVSLPQSKPYFRQDYFEGNRYADLDGYILTAFELRGLLDHEDYDRMDQLFRKMDATGIFHPYVELIRVKYLLWADETEEAEELIQSLIERHPGDFFVLEAQADLLWERDRKDEAMSFYRELAVKNPENLIPKLREVQYSLYQKEYEHTKKKYYALLKNYYYDCIRFFDYEKVFQPIIDEANRNLIPNLEQKCRVGTITDQERMDLGWCYYESDEKEKALEFLLSFEPEAKMEKKYHKLLGILRYHLEDYEQAIRDLSIWSDDAIKQMHSEDFEFDEDTKEKLDEETLYRKTLSQQADISQIFQMIAFAYREMGQKEDSNAIIRHAIEISPENLSLYMHYIYYLSEAKKETEIIDLCTQAMERNGIEETLMLRRAMAYYHMGDYSKADADLEQIFSISTSPLPDVYILKLRLLTAYRMVEEYRQVLESFREAFSKFGMLKLYELRYLRLSGHAQQAMDELEALIEHAKSNGQEFDDRDIAKMHYEQYLCMKDMGNDSKTMSIRMNLIEDVLEKDPDHIEYILAKGSLLEQSKTKEGYVSAEILYKKTLERFPNQIDMLFCMMVIRYDQGHDEDAIYYGRQIIELYPGYKIYVYNYVADALKNLHRMEEAVEILSEKLSIQKRAQDLLERGTLLMELMHLEEAEQDCYAALESDPENSQIYCVLGMVNNLKKDKNLAEQYFKQSIELIEEDYYGYNPFYYLMRFYFMNQRYPESIEILNLAINRFNQPIWALESKMNALIVMKEFEEALAFAEDQMNQLEEKYRDIALTFLTASVYVAMGNPNQAEKMILRKYALYKKDIEFVVKTANFYQNQLNQPEDALKFYKRGYELNPNHYNNLMGICGCTWHILNQKQRNKYGWFFISRKRSLKKDLQFYLLRVRMMDLSEKQEAPFKRGCFLAERAATFLYEGEIKKAQEYALEALRFPACGVCMSYQSAEAYFILAFIELEKGNKSSAVDYLKCAADADVLNRFYQGMLEQYK